MFAKNSYSGSAFLFLATITFEICLILSSEWITTVNSATALEEIKEHPEHPGKCYLRESGVAHELGSRWQVPEWGCAQATCYRSGSDKLFLIAYQTCGSIMADPDCELVEDLTLPYPSCCPSIYCSTVGEPPLDYEVSIESDTQPYNSEEVETLTGNVDESRRSNSIIQSAFLESTKSPDVNIQEKEEEKPTHRTLGLFDILSYPIRRQETYDYDSPDINQISNSQIEILP